MTLCALFVQFNEGGVVSVWGIKVLQHGVARFLVKVFEHDGWALGIQVLEIGVMVRAGSAGGVRAVFMVEVSDGGHGEWVF